MKPKEHIALKAYSHYEIGGPARYFFAPKTMIELRAVAKAAKKIKLPSFVLGGGTNLLIADEGFEGVVIKPDIKILKVSKNRIHAGAGVLMSELLEFATKKGLSGLEWAGGLPGTVGGAIRGNAGCFGGGTKDKIESVESFDLAKLVAKKRKNKECHFGYRSSVFKIKNGKEIVISATFLLKPGNKKEIKRSIDEKVAYRLKHHPIEYPNVGSIFKNVPIAQFKNVKHDGASLAFKKGRKSYSMPVKVDPFHVVPAAYLIAESGVKGVSFGGAMVSPKHPNFIVNAFDAKASDVKTLISFVKSKVKDRFGVTLEEEVQVI